MLSKLTGRERVWIALTLILAVCLFFGGRSLPVGLAKTSTKDDLYDQLKIFTDVMAIVQRDYVTPVSNKKLIEGAIKGMLQTLDPHSGYLDPDFYQDLQVQTKGEFGGLGIEITIKDGLLVVVAPMEGSPAEKAGIKAGDAIVKIEGKFTKDFSLVDAVKRLRGPRGTPITISVQRKGVPGLIDITVVRDIIKVTSVRSRYLGDGLGYVRISQFMEQTADDLHKALEKLKAASDNKELRGIILDLRNNPGGLLTQAIRVSDMFLDGGLIVYTDGRVESQKQKFFAHREGTEPDYPIIVLINGGSASASEIVAGALQDHGRALVLGTQSFGKGSVQTITPLENGGALTLTTALYYTKSGRSIQATGIKPDIVVEPEIQEEPVKQLKPHHRPQPIREGDLPGAIKNPTEHDDSSGLRKINKTPVEQKELQVLRIETVDLNEWLKRDKQFQRAYDLLKTFDVFRDVRQARTEPQAGEREAASLLAAN
ncbi:MAG: S41 family peptidase [Candidatus Dadabacteria bacterium]|nr:MAG: S41 family peptidase [Candidatus Dadabacteria bacterium]